MSKPVDEPRQMISRQTNRLLPATGFDRWIAAGCRLCHSPNRPADWPAYGLLTGLTGV